MLLNPHNQFFLIDVAFVEPENMLANDGTKAIVELGGLFQPWIAAGGKAENAKPINGSIQVQLIDILMQPKEEKPLEIRLTALKPMQVGGTSHKYHFSIQKIIDGKAIGGVDTLITTRALDTDGDGIKDVDDLDNNNNGVSDEEEIRNGRNPLKVLLTVSRMGDGVVKALFPRKVLIAVQIVLKSTLLIPKLL